MIVFIRVVVLVAVVVAVVVAVCSLRSKDGEEKPMLETQIEGWIST